MIIGKTAAGESIEAFDLQSESLAVRITNYGARILSVIHNGVDCVYGPKTAEELLADTCYCGAVCGRVANRIAGGRFSLEGRDYTLATNNGPNCLHGGNVGFDSRVWTVELVTEDNVVLSLTSPDGEEGFPGTLKLRAVYALEGNNLMLNMEAETDAHTILNLTNHVYWNLCGEGTVDTHELSVRADAYTPMVANIPTGRVELVAGTPYDLNAPASLGERFALMGAGYDDNYALHTSPVLETAAVLTAGGRSLSLMTDAPGLQVYTGDYLPLPRGGVALEAQSFPDSPHHSHFPTIEMIAGELYSRSILWTLGNN